MFGGPPKARKRQQVTHVDRTTRIQPGILFLEKNGPTA
jgi:hypothetical protein